MPQTGIRQSSRTMPAIPTRMPHTSWLQTITSHTNTKRKSTDDSEQYSTDSLAVAFNGRLALHLAADDQHGKQHNHSDIGNSNALTKCVSFREQTHTHADSE